MFQEQHHKTQHFVLLEQEFDQIIALKQTFWSHVFMHDPLWWQDTRGF